MDLNRAAGLARTLLLLSALGTVGCTAWYGIPEPDDGGADGLLVDAGPITCLSTGLQTNPRQCGSCSNDCTKLPGVHPNLVVCLAGTCRVDRACLPGLSDCSNACVDQMSDVHHCGSCENDCAHLPGVDPAKVACQAGQCVVSGACLPSRGDCNGDRADGCEVSLTDVSHCGSCAQSCGSAAPNCVESGGVYSCSSGCGGTTPDLCDGICVDRNTDPTACGPSCTFCAAPNGATATCTSGHCGVVCDTGYHLCGSSCLDNTSPSSCGTSCTPCTAPTNGSAICSANRCDFACAAGYLRSGSTCVPIVVTTIASGQGSPESLTGDGTSIYWSNDTQSTTGGAIKKYDPVSGTVSTLIAVDYPMGITTDGASIYWASWSHEVAKVSILGGAKQILAGGRSGDPTDVAVDSSGAVFFSESYSDSIVAVVGGSATAVAAAQSVPEHLTVDANNIYWTTRNGATVMRLSKTGGTPVEIGSAYLPRGLAVDTHYVYWIDQSSVNRVALSGGSATRLASGLTTGWAIALDTNNVYFTDYGGGTVNRIAKSGGSVTTYATAQLGPRGIAVDGISVYWANYGGGTVCKAAK